MKLFKKLFLHSLSQYLFALGIGVTVTLLYALLNGTHLNMYLYGMGLAGLLLILIGGLATTTYFGAFDTFGYSFGKVFNYKKNKNIKLPEYVEQQNIKRKAQNLTFMPYYVVGVLLLIISQILELIF
jgi:hypothetical protein